MKSRDYNYIKYRLNWLKDTAKELKGLFKKSKIPLIEELYLEVEGLSEQIGYRIEKLHTKV